MSKQTIYFGAGCFWCSEAAFTRLKGVSSVISGYAGGHVVDPSYQEVSAGTTGHAEVVQVEYDPQAIKVRDLLAVFFSIHDPTTLNRQGYDIGTQYRSIILYTTEEQKKESEQFITKLGEDGTYKDHIVTEIVQAGDFYHADSSHHRYYDNNRDARYCQAIIDPKITKLRKSFAHLLKDSS